jgi:hypothetical protein
MKNGVLIIYKQLYIRILNNSQQELFLVCKNSEKTKTNKNNLVLEKQLIFA